MKLWRIYQDANGNYDTYDSAIVAAESEEGARQTWPGEIEEPNWRTEPKRYGAWTTPDRVGVQLIGDAAENVGPGVILASFNAG